MTVPEENASSSAPERPVRAACVVRTAARVAVCIPIHPASAEAKAPHTKATAFCQVRAVPMMIATTTTKTASTLYSVFRNAIAPAWIWRAIFFLRSVPSSAAMTFAKRLRA